MQLQSRQVGPVTVLTPVGELTIPTAPAFLRQARLSLAPAGEPLVAVDLADVRRIDSSGYAALVVLLRHVQRRAGEVYLVGLGSEARLLLEIMQLHLLFDVCDDVPAAVAGLVATRTTARAPVSPQRLLGRVRLGAATVLRRAS